MITERNMIFANPLAYRVFPNIGNPMNTGITELAVYQGYLLVTDSTGKTLSFTNTNTIDFTGFSGYVDIDLYSDVGSVKLGRWNMTSSVEPVLPEEYEYVDLGLPSGLLWAKKNIGADTEEDAGLYFQWGDTQGYTAEQVGDGEGLKAFSWADYKWSVDGSSSNFLKYNASDSKTVLDPEDDAAHVVIGGNWRMPTFDECKELCLNTDIYLVPTEGEEIQGTAQEQSGSIMINWASQAEGTLKGVKFYKKGDKQTYMFVPASGGANVGSVQDVGEGGYLYTSSLFSSVVRNAWYFGFNANVGLIGPVNRYYGIPVRGVKSNN